MEENPALRDTANSRWTASKQTLCVRLTAVHDCTSHNETLSEQVNNRSVNNDQMYTHGEYSTTRQTSHRRTDQPSPRHVFATDRPCRRQLQQPQPSTPARFPDKHPPVASVGPQRRGASADPYPSATVYQWQK